MKNVIVFLRPNCYFKTKEALNEKRFFAMNTKEVLGRGKEHVSFTTGEGNSEADDKIYSRTFVAKKMINIFFLSTAMVQRATVKSLLHL